MTPHFIDSLAARKVAEEQTVSAGVRERVRHAINCVSLSISLLIGCACVTQAAEILTPREEAQTFQLPDGFQANLFAAEEMGVLNPLSMRWDADGRLFVISTVGYPQLRPGEAARDKIIMLEDRDGDGRADKSTVFADGLNIPTGLEVGDGGVYVGEQTELVFLKDRDGDGRADHRQVVLSGFGTGDTHQAINSFVWSPGGELFFDQGDGIESRVETPWGVRSLLQAGVVRFRPRRLQMDPILDDFMGPGNPWGIAFDDWGQAFVVDGAGGITFLSPAMMPVKHFRRLRTIGKPGGYCGVEILGSAHLPDDFQGDFLVGDFHRNRISRFSSSSQGAGFEVNWKDPLLVSTHRNFRPVDVRTGPDGAIYVCDWYNSVICHQDDPFRHPDRDFTHGRIWRISHQPSAPVQRPELRTMPTPQLFELLDSPERWVRYQVKRVLAERDRRHVASTALRWWDAEDDRSDRQLYELIGVLETIEWPSRRLLSQLLVSSNHRARAYAARVVGRWHDRIEAPLELLQPRIQDDHPLVRMEAVVSCAHVPDPGAADLIAMASDQSMDYDLDYALTQALHHRKDQWLPTLQRGELPFRGRADRLASVLERVDLPEATAWLRRMAGSDENDAATQLAVLKALARVGDPEDLKTVLHAASHQPNITAALLSELRRAWSHRAVAPAGERSEILKQLIQSDKPEIRLSAVALAGAWRQAALAGPIERIAGDDDGEPRLRKAAITSLGKLGGDSTKAMLVDVARRAGIDLRVSAVAALAWSDDSLAAHECVSLIQAHAKLSESHFTRLVRAFGARQDGLAALHQAVTERPIEGPAADKLLQALNATGHTNPTLMMTLGRAAGIDLHAPEYDAQLVTQLVAAVEKGDPHRGELVFRSKTVNCYACHQIGGVGGKMGPDLSAVGTTLPRDRLVQEVLWPQRHVKDGYALRQIVTTEGQVLQGYVRKGRDGEAVYLVPLGESDAQRIPKHQIEDQRNAGSAMPANVIGVLSPSERTDLLAFLSQLGSPGEFDTSDRGAVREWSVATESSSWRPAISLLSGVLDLDELGFSGLNIAKLRTSFRTHGSRQRVVLDDPFGITLWIDGQPLAVDENMEVALSAGEHELRVDVNLSERSSAALRVEFQNVD